MNTGHLSKSQFTRGLQCLKSLYLYRERNDIQDPVSPEQQAIFDQGTDVGVLAQEWIAGGVLIKASHTEPEKALAETRDAMNAGAKVLYEAAILHSDVLIRADILVSAGVENLDGRPVAIWDIYEIKSTTKVEDTHLDDVAIQRYVLAGAGYRVGRAYLVHLDPGYVRHGKLDLQRLFKAEDVTAATGGLLDLVPGQLAKMKAVAAAAEAPARAIGPHCTKPHDCSFLGHCWAAVPDYSVFDLAGARKDKTTYLWNSGIKTVAEIPDDVKLTAYQQAQRAAARTQQPHVDRETIRAYLETLVYPAYFLDFEAINPAIPPYDGTRPYQAIPTQASVHVQDKPGAPVEHYEFLGGGTADPRMDLAHFLIGNIGGKGSVVAYHKSYEAGILRGLADFYGKPNEQGYLLDMEARLWDLAEPFKKAMYAHPGFKGRWSIKAVLPILVPDMSYKDLAIKDGAAAMRAYAVLMDQNVPQGKRDEIRDDLKEYCSLDTLAMVRILEQLYRDIA